MDERTKIRKIHFGDTSGIYVSKGPVHKIHFGYPGRNLCKIRFVHPIALILPNSHHTPPDPNLKWIHLNTTPSRRLSIMKPASQETSLKDIQNYPTIYKGKEAQFINPNKN